jgi:hypothetical protein
VGRARLGAARPGGDQVGAAQRGDHVAADDSAEDVGEADAGVLITDLYEGGNAEEMLARLGRLIGMGVNVIVLLALSDAGRPAYHPDLSARVAALGAPVFACTPDQFPDLMAAALRRQDLGAWAAQQDIKLVRATE